MESQKKGDESPLGSTYRKRKKGKIKSNRSSLNATSSSPKSKPLRKAILTDQKRPSSTPLLTSSTPTQLSPIVEGKKKGSKIKKRLSAQPISNVKRSSESEGFEPLAKPDSLNAKKKLASTVSNNKLPVVMKFSPKHLQRSNTIAGGPINLAGIVKPQLSADGFLGVLADTSQEYVRHWCTLANGVLCCYEDRPVSAFYNPRFGKLPDRPSHRFDVTMMRGVEVAENRTHFKLILGDEGEFQEVYLKCEDKAEARIWLFTVQRSVLHKAKEDHSLTQRGPKPRSRGRRHTISGGETFKPPTYDICVGPFFEGLSAINVGRRRKMEDQHLMLHDLSKEREKLHKADSAKVDGTKASKKKKRASSHAGVTAAARSAASKKVHEALFAVYDGHSGRGAVDHTLATLHKNLLTHSLFDSDLKKALEEAFISTDESFRKHATEAEDFSGTTALVAVLRDRLLTVANVGDCRAVLSRQGKAIDLSSDHKPHREDEVERIVGAGGWIETAEVLNVPRLYALGLEDEELDEDTEEMVGWVTVRRVNGCLSVTRSIGDILIKDWKTVQFEDTEFTDEFIISKPEIKSMEVIDGDEFLIMASDGLWDVFKSQEAVDWVKEKMKRVAAVKAFLGEEMCIEAIRRGSLDNITVLLVFFERKEEAIKLSGHVLKMVESRGNDSGKRYCEKRFLTFSNENDCLQMYNREGDENLREVISFRNSLVRVVPVDLSTADAAANDSKATNDAGSGEGGGGSSKKRATKKKKRRNKPAARQQQQQPPQSAPVEKEKESLIAVESSDCQFAFKFNVGTKSFTFLCASAEERNEWVKALKTVEKKTHRGSISLPPSSFTRRSDAGPLTSSSTLLHSSTSIDKLEMSDASEKNKRDSGEVSSGSLSFLASSNFFFSSSEKSDSQRREARSGRE